MPGFDGAGSLGTYFPSVFDPFLRVKDGVDIEHRQGEEFIAAIPKDFEGAGIDIKNPPLLIDAENSYGQAVDAGLGEL